jgi:hypothetical protein
MLRGSTNSRLPMAPPSAVTGTRTDQQFRSGARYGHGGVSCQTLQPRNYAHVCRAFDAGQDRPFARAACPTHARVVASNGKLPATMPCWRCGSRPNRNLRHAKTLAPVLGDTPVKLELSTRPYELGIKIGRPMPRYIGQPRTREPHGDSMMRRSITNIVRAGRLAISVAGEKIHGAGWIKKPTYRIPQTRAI